MLRCLSVHTIHYQVVVVDDVRSFRISFHFVHAATAGNGSSRDGSCALAVGTSANDGKDENSEIKWFLVNLY